MKTLTFNVGFKLEVPLVRDKFGKINPANLVAPYIEDYMKEMQLASAMVRHWGDNLEDSKFDPKDFELTDIQKEIQKEAEKNAYEWVNSKIYQDRVEKQKEQHDKWLIEQNRQCRELYNMRYEDFRSLTFEKMQRKREECNVIWEDGKWVKRNN